MEEADYFELVTALRFAPVTDPVDTTILLLIIFTHLTRHKPAVKNYGHYLGVKTEWLLW